MAAAAVLGAAVLTIATGCSGRSEAPAPGTTSSPVTSAHGPPVFSPSKANRQPSIDTREKVRSPAAESLRRLTADDPERRKNALEFQRVVDKLFSLGGFRGEDDESPVKLARRFRELAGFDDAEIDEIAEVAHEALREAQDRRDRLAADAAVAG